MALFEADPKPLTLDDVKGSIWEGLTALKEGQQVHPFSVDSPTQDEPPMLVAGQSRRITYRGSGQVLLFNIDLPAGVTMALFIDGVTKRFSHGNEAGVLRWEYGKSPLRFTNSLEVVVTNTTGAGQTYKVHVSGA
jgi:hypothetical protein